MLQNKSDIFADTIDTDFPKKYGPYEDRTHDLRVISTAL